MTIVGHPLKIVVGKGRTPRKRNSHSDHSTTGPSWVTDGPGGGEILAQPRARLVDVTGANWLWCSAAERQARLGGTSLGPTATGTLQ